MLIICKLHLKKCNKYKKKTLLKKIIGTIRIQIWALYIYMYYNIGTDRNNFKKILYYMSLSVWNLYLE